MIKVKLKRHDNLKDVEVSGHALFAEFGKDVVCAGVSSIVIGALNALGELTDYNTDQVTIKEGYVHIPDIFDDPQVQLVLNTMVVQLNTVWQSFPEYMDISIV
ncbi:ribosomal-processing cysteine protease Prp [Haloplasma contractile]|uniref:Ribosomal processing cysteine protease Prp n=1 Tax=Haloplasma contractile SSD-17B TaxID=1033810 RepID=F7PWZ2_9MOLU|nr:ribosomal-processing cysteine protease Prp [Haloplasma contractile]ERJ12769.1 putative ribosomal protein [Haloplasma contractile SSD-17B]